MDNVGIIIQGPLNHLKNIRESWKNFKDNIIFSTWSNQKHLLLETDVAVFSDYPTIPGPGNLFYQTTTTLAGLLEAKKRGYKYCLKIRSDILPTSDINFINILDKTKFNFLCWHNHIVYPNYNGYLVDYLMSGLTDQLIDLWNINSSFCDVAEIMLTAKFKEKFTNNDILYFLKMLTPQNDLYWIKYKTFLSSYNLYKGYRTTDLE